MASWLDVASFILIFALFIGTIIGTISVVRRVSNGFQSIKESLRNRGCSISSEGVTIKTSHRFNREDYVDATQRAFVGAIHASTYGSASSPSNHGSPTLQAPVLEKKSSSTSLGRSSTTSEKKRGFLGGIRRTHSSRSKWERWPLRESQRFNPRQGCHTLTDCNTFYLFWFVSLRVFLICLFVLNQPCIVW